MGFRCERCEKENLQCFVSTQTGECVGCTAAHSRCSLFVPEDKWEKIQEEKRQRQLEIARLEAQLAQSRLKLLETEETARSYAKRDLAVLDVQDKSQEEGEADSAPGAAPAEPSMFSPVADLGWSQAEYDHSLLSSVAWSTSDLEFFFPDVSGGTPVPVTCSP